MPSLPEPAASHRVQAFDTLRQQLVPIGPTSGVARMYVCGITPYDATHIGHANTYVAFDLLNRTWRDRGLDVQYVQNVTDIDDPLLERAKALGVDWAELAVEQTDLFREDMAALNVLPPEHYVGAVESIPLVVELIQRLRERGAIYAVDDSAVPRPVLLPDGRPRVRVALQTARGRGPRGLRRAWRRPGPSGQAGAPRLSGLAAGATGRAVVGVDARGRAAGLAHRVHRDRARSARAGLRRAGGRQRPGVPTPRDVRRRGPGGDRPAVRAGVPAQRDGRPGRAEDVQVARQPGLRLGVAPIRRRSDGHPAGVAGASLPR